MFQLITNVRPIQISISFFRFHGCQFTMRNFVTFHGWIPIGIPWNLMLSEWVSPLLTCLLNYQYCPVTMVDLGVQLISSECPKSDNLKRTLLVQQVVRLTLIRLEKNWYRHIDDIEAEETMPLELTRKEKGQRHHRNLRCMDQCHRKIQNQD